jgi:hypothetical protein
MAVFKRTNLNIQIYLNFTYTFLALELRVTFNLLRFLIIRAQHPN